MAGQNIQPLLPSCRILVVETESSIRVSLCDSMTEAGATVVAATDGEDAVAQLAKDHLDVVVTAIDLPGMTGLELLVRIKETQPDLPVIVLTTYQRLDQARAALDRGAYDYATKPFPDEKIIRMVANAWSLTQMKYEVSHPM